MSCMKSTCICLLPPLGTQGHGSYNPMGWFGKHGSHVSLTWGPLKIWDPSGLEEGLFTAHAVQNALRWGPRGLRWGFFKSERNMP